MQTARNINAESDGGRGAYTLADTKMPGLLLRKGKRRTAWHFYNDRSLHALRHCYRDAALAAGVDEFSARLLMGHSLRGISQEYLTRAVISSGPSLRAAHRAISRRIVALLNPTVKAPALSPEQDAETALLPALR